MGENYTVNYYLKHYGRCNGRQAYTQGDPAEHDGKILSNERDPGVD